MFLHIMGLCVISSIALSSVFGIAKSKAAETIGLITSLICCVWFIGLLMATSISSTNYIKEMSKASPALDHLSLFPLYPPAVKPFSELADTGLQSITEISVDGLSLVFLGLTVVVTPIAILAAETRTEMISSLLAVEALLIGAFITLDCISFYALFESTLIPMFFLIGYTGSGKALIRSTAATRFFLYTLGGSVLMLLALIGLYLERGCTNWYNLVLSGAIHESDGIPNYSSLIAFAFIFFAFAVKVPMIPVHLWLPEAHTIAPTPGSMILAALLLKLGGYGILRWLIPIFPEAALYFQPFILTLSVISQIYACGSCLRQIDIKRIVAYSSIVHMNGCIFAIFSLSYLALKAAVFEMFSHGIISAGMFFLIGVLYSRYKTRTLAYYRGLSITMPLFSTFFFLFILANSAVPLTSGFIGEALMLSGTMSVIPIYTIIISIVMVANGAYNIWLFNRLCFGSLTPYIKTYKDLTFKEASLLVVLTTYLFILGLSPNCLFYFLDNRYLSTFFFFGNF